MSQVCTGLNAVGADPDTIMGITSNSEAVIPLLKQQLKEPRSEIIRILNSI